MKGVIHGLDLFSGIGGISLGIKRAFASYGMSYQTRLYVDIEKRPQEILQQRSMGGDIDFAPVWDNILTLHGGVYKGDIDLITGGFPCQDTSRAGKGVGITKKTRSGLFYEMWRVIREARPDYVFMENSTDISNNGLAEVTAEITKSGYGARWYPLSAADVGADHIRERWWCLAYHKSLFGHVSETYKKKSARQKPQFRNGDSKTNMGESHNRGYWSSESGVARVVYGVSAQVDRNKAIGNAVVPQCVEYVIGEVFKLPELISEAARGPKETQ